MSEINIAGSIKELMIFDDPEYCEGVGECKFIKYGRCNIFDADLVLKPGNYYQKCPACKKGWKKAKDASDPVKIQQRIDDNFFDSEYA